MRMQSVSDINGFQSVQFENWADSFSHMATADSSVCVCAFFSGIC